MARALPGSETFFDDAPPIELPRYEVATVDDVETASEQLRSVWELGLIRLRI